MTRVIQYSGKEPTFSLPEGVSPAKVMELLEEQIKVLKALTTQVVMVPEGTKIRENDINLTEELGINLTWDHLWKTWNAMRYDGDGGWTTSDFISRLGKKLGLEPPK